MLCNYQNKKRVKRILAGDRKMAIYNLTCAICCKHFKTKKGFWNHVYYGNKRCRKLCIKRLPLLRIQKNNIAARANL